MGRAGGGGGRCWAQPGPIPSGLSHCPPPATPTRFPQPVTGLASSRPGARSPHPLHTHTQRAPSPGPHPPSSIPNPNPEYCPLSYPNLHVQPCPHPPVSQPPYLPPHPQRQSRIPPHPSRQPTLRGAWGAGGRSQSPQAEGWAEALTSWFASAVDGVGLGPGLASFPILSPASGCSLGFRVGAQAADRRRSALTKVGVSGSPEPVHPWLVHQSQFPCGSPLPRK